MHGSHEHTILESHMTEIKRLEKMRIGGGGGRRGDVGRSSRQISAKERMEFQVSDKHHDEEHTQLFYDQ